MSHKFHGQVVTALHHSVCGKAKNPEFDLFANHDKVAEQVITVLQSFGLDIVSKPRPIELTEEQSAQIKQTFKTSGGAYKSALNLIFPLECNEALEEMERGL